MAPRVRFLVLGCGRSGRFDDGLGPACADELARLGLEDVRVEIGHPLRGDTAWLVARHRYVVFVEASLDGPAPWSLEELVPGLEVQPESESTQPASILSIAHQIFDARTRGFLLRIRGYEFDGSDERLSSAACIHLADAVRFLVEVVQGGGVGLLESQTTPSWERRASEPFLSN